MYSQRQIFCRHPLNLHITYVMVFVVCFSYINQSFADNCQDGYTALEHMLSSTFVAPVNNVCQFGGYQLIEIPDDFYPIYDGFVMGAEVPLCNGGHLSGNTCTTFEQSVCDDTYYDLALITSTFMAPVNDICQAGGYTLTGVPDEFYPIYSGFLMGAEVALCGAGTHPSGNTCVENIQGDCPTDYIDISLSDTIFDTLSEGNCTTGYTKYQIRQQCNKNPTDAMCAALCTGDLYYTDIGTCANLCTQGSTSFKMSMSNGTILSFPMYDTKQITPSINFRFNNGEKCYVNLLEGSTTNALHISDPSTHKTYHTVR